MESSTATVNSLSRQIETPRLYLRQFTPDDLDELYRIYSDAEVMKYLSEGVRNKEETAADLFQIIGDWEKHGFGLWAVVNKQNNQLIGDGGLRFLGKTPEVEVGYVLAKAYWGKGLASEVAAATLKYGFEVLKLDKVVAVADTENRSSRRVMEKVGMKYQHNFDDCGRDRVYYAIARL
ncbi:MAG: N-acetyltransferase [Oscillatoriales cyanobacterium]|uniref:GNAT family N-acetyltransferase n=1 Tax=Microcoleus sp. PH2017_05_CCC_O_A TaxID=2798816 RepID=UPI001E160A2D|nr:GNAT family N-acetyltransferase [Microcoleus sp. PH2017_05_CCC_O_A]MCC3439065.1 GNAT family N-acetyltransferase [Microcoleus sp. PH2017_05_CCC_O_A]TAG18881.1 MAG: N-acetyltransferase [Oscillatoriales cyanobacterium]TAG48487.1 MAG: N-acetyltransferase [Oscillatoriales cyanobacterium]